jgi:hypothetical protein
LPASAAAREEELASLLPGGPQVLIDCLTGLLRQLESDWPARLSLTHRRTVDGNTLRSYVIHRQVDDIAPSQLAIDREIEHREVAHSPLDLQFCADGPNVFRSERRFRAGQFALVPGVAAWSLKGSF